MGNFDISSKHYISDPVIFADICNYVLYNGRQVITPDNLEEKNVSELTFLDKNNSKHSKAIEKFRDVIKNVTIKDDSRATYLLFGIENQLDIHYAMPVRNMIYDALNYGAQVNDIAKHNREHNDSDRDFLTGLKPTDKIKPVITITIYFGYKEWDGPRSLYDMFPEDTPDELLDFINDYPINILVPHEINDFSKFSSDFGILMELIKNVKEPALLSNSLQNISRELSNDAIRVFEHFSNTIKFRKKGVDYMLPPELEKEYEIFYGQKARIKALAEGEAIGKSRGETLGKAKDLVLYIDTLAETFGYDKAFELLKTSEDKYNQAKKLLEECENDDEL